jgi:uncharacterized repeat protein (TIGR03803 family)
MLMAGLALTPKRAHAQTETYSETVLYSFCSQNNCNDGRFPEGTLVEGTDGDLYGTTESGGTNSSVCPNSPYGCGEVFKLTPAGELTVLYDFCSLSGCSDGSSPVSGLILGKDGNFYGTTVFGGTTNSNCSAGCGTIFKLTPEGILTTLYNFCTQSNCTDGEDGPSALVQGTDGNFYGITGGGGVNGPICGIAKTTCGTVFKVTPSGEFTTLYSFCNVSGCTDGYAPASSLIQGANGIFYRFPVQRLWLWHNLFDYTFWNSRNHLPVLQSSELC